MNKINPAGEDHQTSSRRRGSIGEKGEGEGEREGKDEGGGGRVSGMANGGGEGKSEGPGSSARDKICFSVFFRHEKIRDSFYACIAAVLGKRATPRGGLFYVSRP